MQHFNNGFPVQLSSVNSEDNLSFPISVLFFFPHAGELSSRSGTSWSLFFVQFRKNMNIIRY